MASRNHQRFRSAPGLIKVKVVWLSLSKLPGGQAFSHWGLGVTTEVTTPMLSPVCSMTTEPWRMQLHPAWPNRHLGSAVPGSRQDGQVAETAAGCPNLVDCCLFTHKEFHSGPLQSNTRQCRALSQFFHLHSFNSWNGDVTPHWGMDFYQKALHDYYRGEVA